MENSLKHNKKWSDIKTKLIGRTENSVKNKYKSLIKKWKFDLASEDFCENELVKKILQAKKNEKSQQENGKICL